MTSKPFRRPSVAVGENLPPTLHTDQKFPVGFNETYYQIMEDLVKPPEKSEEEVPVKTGVMHTKMYSDEDVNSLRAQWFEKYKDILQGVPDKLPPLREVNHEIPLIDEDKHYGYYLPRCPDALKPQLMDKIGRYTANGWWKLQSVSQAAPMLCIPKKDGTLRTAIDLRKRNDNTFKDVTP